MNLKKILILYYINVFYIGNRVFYILIIKFFKIILFKIKNINVDMSNYN